MQTVKGQYASATVMTDDMEAYARAQLQMICDNQVAENSIIKVMPDVHPGKVGPIGLTMTVGDKVIPNLLGIDIGCGVTCVRLKDKRFEPQKLDSVIRERVPAGTAIRETAHWKAELFEYDDLCCRKHINLDKAARSLGTLGGGNHFIEIDQDSQGCLSLLIHSGSRHLGKEVAEYYIEMGARELKAKGLDVPYPMTWLEGEWRQQYIADVQTIQAYAELNRQIIVDEIIKGMKWKAVDQFSSVHNYMIKEFHGGKETLVLRKGAISARKDEPVIIPINMRDGAIIGKGLGNEEWNYSAPHGSGRLIKRDEVKNQYTVSHFKKEMKNIYCSCIGTDTLDEAPFAYRRIEQIMEKITPTVEVCDVMKPLYNFKAGKK